MKKILSLLLILILSGCSSQSIDTGAHPLAIGIDYSSTSKLFTESGLFYLYDGEKVDYTVISTDGITVGEAMEKKTGYSYKSVNYALLGAIALGEGALQLGMHQALFPLLKWASLPAEDILVCAADTAIGIIDSKQLPDLLKNASNEGYLPKTSLKDCMVSIYENSPILLPYVIKKPDGIYINGSVVVENGVITAYYDGAQTLLWGLLYYAEGEGVVTSGGVSVQCRTKRTFNKKENRIELELSMRLISHGDPEVFRQALEKALNEFVDNLGCDIICCGISPISDASVTVKTKPY